MIRQALGQSSVSVRSKGTMQQTTVSCLERTESIYQFHQDFLCCQTKTTMIHDAILFSIHHDSKSLIGEFTLQCRQTVKFYERQIVLWVGIKNTCEKALVHLPFLSDYSWRETSIEKKKINHWFIHKFHRKMP